MLSCADVLYQHFVFEVLAPCAFGSSSPCAKLPIFRSLAARLIAMTGWGDEVWKDDDKAQHFVALSSQGFA